MICPIDKWTKISMVYDRAHTHTHTHIEYKRSEITSEYKNKIYNDDEMMVFVVMCEDEAKINKVCT